MAIQLRPLTANALFVALANRWIDADQLERQSSQAKYILAYLQKPQVDARCFLIEEPYVDGDYLEDFVSFYVSSFPPYDRYCRRLHFFDRDFTEAQVEEMLLGDNPASCVALQESYVGFIVVRPLPEAVIGRTALRTYREDGSGRAFPTLRDYKPFLNGVPLSVRSLAFEEQDTSVAACATVALWSAFHKTHELFGTHRPRPAAITRAANVVRTSGRALPSGGLNPMQIGEAVRAVGLEPEFYRFGPETPLASLMYAYLSAGIPLILGIYIEDIGFHAVTVVGYSMPRTPAAVGEPEYYGVKSRAGLHIDKLYLHDDGTGPYAVAPIVPAIAGLRAPSMGNDPPVLLESDWDLPTPQPARQHAYFIPQYIVVPAYEKIRVPYFAIHQWIQRLMRMYHTLHAPFANNGIDVDRITWDIKLTMMNDFKESIRKDLWGNVDARSLSQDPLPRFIWTATMHYDDAPSQLLVFDATDTERTCPLLRSVWLDGAKRGVLDAMFADPAFESIWRIPLTPRFYDALKEGKATFL